MKKAICLVMALVMLLALCACGGGTPAPAATNAPSGGGTPATQAPSGGGSQPTAAPAPGGNDQPAAPAKDTVTIGVDGDTGSLDPFLVSGNFLNVMYQYAEPLWTYDGYSGGFASRYLLAESVDTISPTEYIIHLRKGVKFSNGSDFNADDVIYTFQYVKNESNIAYYIPYVDVDKMTADDEYTVHFYLTAYDKTAMSGTSSICMIDKETYDPETSGRNPIGTGPYVVTDYVVNSSLSMTARDDYWGGAPAIKNIVYKNIPEPSQKINALETGEVDIILSCPTSDVEYVDSLDGVSVISKGSVNQINLTYNCCAGSPLETKEARLAVSYAVNRAGILAVALNGVGQAAHAPFSASCGDYTPEIANMTDVYQKDYDLETAKKLAEESGLVGKTVRLITNGNDIYVSTAQIIEQALKEIGVNAEVHNSDQATVRNMIAGEEGWEVYVSWISNPSGIGADMIFSQVCKFGRAHVADAAVLAEFDAKGKALLATSDDADYKAQLIDYVKAFEEECFMFGVADMTTNIAAYDYLKGLSTKGINTELVQDWSFG